MTQLSEIRKVSQLVKSHLDRVQQLHEKVPQSGDTVRHIEGFCESTVNDQHTITSACVPYLQLQKHGQPTNQKLDLRFLLRTAVHSSQQSSSSETQPELVDTAHPVRTLFQSLNSRSNSRRDLKQVVCQMLDPQDMRYLCLSQAWFLIINEGQIIYQA